MNSYESVTIHNFLTKPTGRGRTSPARDRTLRNDEWHKLAAKSYPRVLVGFRLFQYRRCTSDSSFNLSLIDLQVI